MNKDIMKYFGFSEEVKLVEENRCPFCKLFIDKSSFTDELSVEEYKISGVCQKCQDDFFKEF